MITLRRASERRHERLRKQDVWRTFWEENRTDVLAGGFAPLEGFDEDRLPPGAGAPRHPPREAELVTYVCEGTLAHEDSMGRSGVIHAGEFQCTSVGRGLRRSETNASRTHWAHVFQIWLRPSGAGLDESGHEQKRFSVAQRRGGLCLVASPDASRGSLRLHQDTRVYSALLDPGQHLVHALPEGRRAWLHLVQGEVTLDDLLLRTGDGAGVTAERALSLTAREATELLLVDLGEWTPGPR